MGTDNSSGESTSDSVDWGKGFFDLGGKAINGYFTLQTAKVTSSAVTKAPTGSIIAVAGAVVAVFLILFVLRK
jgi:hypothetical protein